MNADAFVQELQDLAKKVMTAKAGEYPHAALQAARTWADIRKVDPPPKQVVRDEIANLLAYYYISPVAVGEFQFVIPWPGRRLRFLTFKPANSKPINLYVDTFENVVYQAPNTWDTQTSIDQASSDFLDCLASYAFYLSHRTIPRIRVTAELRSLESEFLGRISRIPGSGWWEKNIALHR